MPLKVAWLKANVVILELLAEKDQLELLASKVQEVTLAAKEKGVVVDQCKFTEKLSLTE